MPNWSFNRLVFKHKKDMYNAMRLLGLRDLKILHTDTGEDIHMCFDILKPIPGWRYLLGIEPTVLTFGSKTYSLEGFHILVNKYTKKYGREKALKHFKSFKCNVSPDCYFFTRYGLDALLDYMIDNPPDGTYFTGIKATEWGTKWQAGNVYIKGFTIYYDTPWCEPSNVLRALSEYVHNWTNYTTYESEDGEYLTFQDIDGDLTDNGSD